MQVCALPAGREGPLEIPALDASHVPIQQPGGNQGVRVTASGRAA